MGASKRLSVVLWSVSGIGLLLLIVSIVLLCCSLSNLARLREMTDVSFLALNLRLDTLEQELDASDALPTIQEHPQETEFRIHAEGDCICVYFNGNLIHTLTVSIEMLPAKDRALLIEGITVTSWDDLVRCLQDYTS